MVILPLPDASQAYASSQIPSL